jgi:5'(3')-deoxyribonucleotidase
VIIALDIDSVIANLEEVWIANYNSDYDDDLKISEIREWDISKFVKAECGKKIYDYLNNPGLYKTVKPIENSLEAVKRLSEFGRIIYVTTFHPVQAGKKYQWLQKNGFDVSIENYIECGDKSLIQADMMIDDNYKNLLKFKGMPYIFSQPWNFQYNHMNRIKDWKSFLEEIDEIRI